MSVSIERRAKKDYKCSKCGQLINKGELHRCIYIGGGGLGSLKFPDREHLNCPKKEEQGEQ